MDQSSVIVLENLLSKTYLKNTQTLLSGHHFPWYWNHGTLSKPQPGDVPQLTHTFFNDQNVISDWFTQVQPIINFVEKELNIQVQPVRIKANMMYKLPHDVTQVANPPHVDQQYDPDPSYFSFVFYPYDCEGDTLLCNEFYPQEDTSKLTLHKTNTPKENSCVFFNSNRYHSSSSPTVSDRRIIINFVVKVL